MNAPNRRRRSARRSAEQPVPQLARGKVRNRYAPFAILSDDQLEAIHLASMHILEEIGIEVMSDAALDRFAAAGAKVDRSSRTVFLDRNFVAEKIATSPSCFTLSSRNAENSVELGGNAINFTLAAGPPNVHDRERGRRAGNMEDYCDLVRLAQHFNAIHMFGNQVCAPIELPANSRHLDTYLANLTLTDKCFHVSAIGRGRAVDGAAMAAIARGMTLEETSDDPSVTTIISVNSPRRFDDAMADGMMALAELGQSVCVTPFTLMGAMSPVTLAGALAQQNAEALFGVVLTQIVNPGAPVIYGAFTSNVDMRSGAPAFGTPENAKANLAAGQLARRYQLPYRTSPCSASNAADAQGAWETMMALWSAVLGHGNLIYHGAGWQEGGLTVSYEKLVQDVEMIQHMISFLEPVSTEEPELALDALARVKPGGHFFGDAHTLERYSTAFYQPMLSDWQNNEAWVEAGAADASERATAIWKKALDEYQQPPLDEARREALEAYVVKRKEEIGDGEP